MYETKGLLNDNHNYHFNINAMKGKKKKKNVPNYWTTIMYKTKGPLKDFLRKNVKKHNTGSLH